MQVIDPFVTIEVFGIPADISQERTRTVPHNGRYSVSLKESDPPTLYCELLLAELRGPKGRQAEPHKHPVYGNLGKPINEFSHGYHG